MIPCMQVAVLVAGAADRVRGLRGDLRCGLEGPVQEGGVVVGFGELGPEEVLGHELFDRSNRRLEVSEAGRLVLTGDDHRFDNTVFVVPPQPARARVIAIRCANETEVRRGQELLRVDPIA